MNTCLPLLAGLFVVPRSLAHNAKIAHHFKPHCPQMGPMQLPCRSRSFLPVKGTTRRNERQVCLATAHAARTLPRTLDERKPKQKRLKPVAVSNRPTEPHKRPAAPWHRFLISLPCVNQNHYCGYNNYCSSPPSLVPKGLGFCALSRHDRSTHTSYQSNSSRSKLK